MSKLFAVGDLHGNHDELIKMLSLLGEKGIFNIYTDQMVFLGDYVDSQVSGDMASLVEMLIRTHEVSTQHVFLRGNHEQLLLDAIETHPYDPVYQTWWQQGGQQTYESYQRTFPKTALMGLPFPHEHIAWFRSLPYFYETDDYIFVHAGLRDGLPPIANGAEDMLWLRKEFIESEYDWGKKVIFGHTPQMVPLVMDNKIGIDTIHRKGGYITIAELPTPDDGNYIFHTLKSLTEDD